MSDRVMTWVATCSVPATYQTSMLRTLVKHRANTEQIQECQFCNVLAKPGWKHIWSRMYGAKMPDWHTKSDIIHYIGLVLGSGSVQVPHIILLKNNEYVSHHKKSIWSWVSLLSLVTLNFQNPAPKYAKHYLLFANSKNKFSQKAWLYAKRLVQT